MKIMIAAVVVLTSACVTADVRYVPIEYRMIDQPQSNSIRLVYENTGPESICLDAGNWPSTGGILNNNGREFYLTIDGIIYFLQREQDYCPVCVIKVRPLQAIEANLSYASFGLPEALYNRPKALHLEFTGYVCR